MSKKIFLYSSWILLAVISCLAGLVDSMAGLIFFLALAASCLVCATAAGVLDHENFWYLPVDMLVTDLYLSYLFAGLPAGEVLLGLLAVFCLLCGFCFYLFWRRHVSLKIISRCGLLLKGCLIPAYILNGILAVVFKSWDFMALGFLLLLLSDACVWLALVQAVKKGWISGSASLLIAGLSLFFGLDVLAAALLAWKISHAPMEEAAIHPEFSNGPVYHPVHSSRPKR